MALFYSERDISLFRRLNKELINRIIDVTVYYYKLIITETKTNIYGETKERSYYNPIKITAIVEMSGQEWQNNSGVQDQNRTGTISFLRDTLKTDIGNSLYPEGGDIIEWEGDYYEVDGVQDYQSLANKGDYWEGGETHGQEWSIVCNVHKTRKEIVNLVEYRVPPPDEDTDTLIPKGL